MFNGEQQKKEIEKCLRIIDKYKAEKNAKDLAERIYEQITEEANYIYADRKWYFEKVVHYMRAESEE